MFHSDLAVAMAAVGGSLLNCTLSPAFKRGFFLVGSDLHLQPRNLMKITINKSDSKADAYGFLLEEGTLSSAAIKSYEKKFGISLTDFLKQNKFKGNLLETVVFPVLKSNKLVHLVFVGLGKKGTSNTYLEHYRRALAHLYNQCVARKLQSMSIIVPSKKTIAVSDELLGQQSATTLLMADYYFDTYKSEKDAKKHEVQDVNLVVSMGEKEFKKGIKDGEYIAQAVNKARHWIDLPPQDLTPPELAKKAKSIAKKTGLKVTVFDEKQVTKMGMGGLKGVSRGSDVDCQLVILEYKTKKKNAPTLAFVGKGITFDSGGLSLKPPAYMETMKEDMSGAAAVIATMEALAHLKPDVNVVGVTPLAENLPSGKATKPGDILTFYNGKTAEVRNTDAEGRLVLADALAYTAKHYKPDAIIDMATLTGACAYALGPFFTGMMSQDEKLVKKLEASADRSGDRVWRLPLHDDYKVAIKSDVADICNIGKNNYMAGATTAAHFLQNFVEKYPWVHLDIAGTAFNVPDMPYYKPGATGVGVRLLVDFAMHWK